MRTTTLAALLLSVCMPAASGEPPKSAGQQAGPQTQQPSAASQPREQEHRGTEQAPLVVKTYPQQSNAEATEVKRDRREKRHAESWAITIGIITILILAVQSIVFLWQGCQLRRTVGEMKTATIATRKVAKALQKSARAWVLIETPIFRNSHPDVALDVDVMIKNYGQSPAFLTASFGKLIGVARTKRGQSQHMRR